MEPVIDTSTFVILITTILSFVGALVLFYFSRNKTVHNRWLAAYFLCSAYGLLVEFLLYSKLIVIFPWYHIYRTGYIAAFLLMPFSYFYVRSLTQQKKFKWKDAINFLPAIVFVIDLFPFYLSSPEHKIQQINIDANALDSGWADFSQGWIEIGFIYVHLRIALTILYWVLQLRMFRSLYKLAKGNNLLAENRDLILWIKVFLTSQTLFFLPYFLNVMSASPQHFFFATHTLLALSIGISLLALFMIPKVLYGLKGVVIYKTATAGDEEKKHQVLSHSSDSYGYEKTDKKNNEGIAPEEESTIKKGGYISKDKLELLSNVIMQHIVHNESYLKKGYTVGTLAAEIKHQPYLVSAVINQVFHTNANDFINQYRVNYAKGLIQKGEAKSYTLEALAERCGFNNRNSFTDAFKKHTGKTPSIFIKGFKMNDIDI